MQMHCLIKAENMAHIPTTRETILVVDDNAEVLAFVVAILKGAAFKVLSAHDGAGAIEIAKQTEDRIDLLLSDVDMPAISGADLRETLKRRGQTYT